MELGCGGSSSQLTDDGLGLSTAKKIHDSRPLEKSHLMTQMWFGSVRQDCALKAKVGRIILWRLVIVHEHAPMNNHGLYLSFCRQVVVKHSNFVILQMAGVLVWMQKIVLQFNLPFPG